MKLAPATGSTFEVIGRQGRVFYSAPIGAFQGVWSNAYPFVYALDFDSVEVSGAYHIVVHGPFRVHTLSFFLQRMWDDNIGTLY